MYKINTFGCSMCRSVHLFSFAIGMWMLKWTHFRPNVVCGPTQCNGPIRIEIMTKTNKASETVCTLCFTNTDMKAATIHIVTCQSTITYWCFHLFTPLATQTKIHSNPRSTYLNTLSSAREEKANKWRYFQAGKLFSFRKVVSKTESPLTKNRFCPCS